MAGEILHSGLVSGGNLRLDEVLAAEWDRLLAERSALPAHPAIRYAGRINQAGAAEIKVPLLGVGGYNLPALTTEGASVANTALTTGKVSITVGQYSLAREATTLAMLTSPNGDISPETFALDCIEGDSALLVSLVANVVDGFTTVVGDGAAGDFTLADYLESKTTLRGNKVQGVLMGMFSTRQWGDLMADVGLSSGGVLSRDPNGLDLIGGEGLGYEGRYLGIDCFVTTHVVTDSGAHKGGIWGATGVYWADAAPMVDGNDGNQLVLGGRVLFERVRDGRKAQTAWVGHTWKGVTKGQDLAGVTISSQST